MDRYGYPQRSMDEIKSFVGNGVVRLLELSVPEGKANPRFEGLPAGV